MPASRSPVRRPAYVATAVLLIGLIGSILAGAYAQAQSEALARARFDEAALQAKSAIEIEVRADLDKLHDIGAFVTTGSPPSPAEFSQFVERAGVFKRFQSLVGVIILRTVPPSEVDAFVAEQQAVIPGFAVIPFGDKPPDATSYVVTYYAPGALDFELPAGLDVGAIESVRSELDRRGDLGQSAAGAVQNDPLLQRLGQQLDSAELNELLSKFDFIMAAPAPGVDERGQKTLTWVAAPIGGFDEVLARSLQNQPTDLGVSLTVGIDNPGVTTEEVKRVAQRQNPPGTIEEAAFSRELSFETDGIKWSLDAWSSPTAKTDGGSTRSLVTVVGVAGSLFAAAFVYLRLRHRQQAQVLAELVSAHERTQIQRDVVTSVSEAVVVLDHHGNIVTANPGWEHLRGRSSPTDDGVTPDQGKPYVDALREAGAIDVSDLDEGLRAVRTLERDSVEVDLALLTAGRKWWTAVRITPLHAEIGALVVVHRDITARKRSEDNLERRATFDALTGLLNRPALEERARARLDRARSEGALVGMLFIDLDDFKGVNDMHGHAVGDAVLRIVAARIAGTVRNHDLVARLGGDEFVVFLDRLESREVAEELADRILVALETDVQVGSVFLPIRASIGVSTLEGSPLESFPRLVRLADEAMYDAKRCGGARYAAGLDESSAAVVASPDGG